MTLFDFFPVFFYYLRVGFFPIILLHPCLLSSVSVLMQLGRIFQTEGHVVTLDCIVPSAESSDMQYSRIHDAGVNAV